MCVCVFVRERERVCVYVSVCVCVFLKVCICICMQMCFQWGLMMHINRAFRVLLLMYIFTYSWFVQIGHGSYFSSSSRQRICALCILMYSVLIFIPALFKELHLTHLCFV